jgi:hypothetical protein
MRKASNNSAASSVSATTNHWIPPEQAWVMINTDGAFQSDSGKGGWGCIGRDHEGVPVFAAAGALSNAGEALRTEAHAMLQAAKLADQLGIGRPIFATDCQVLKTAVTSNSYDAAPLGALFREIKYQLQLSFIEFKVIYVHRDCNKPAHVLAALGVCEPLGSQRFWTEDYPAAVSKAVSGDYAGQF